MDKKGYKLGGVVIIIIIIITLIYIFVLSDLSIEVILSFISPIITIIALWVGWIMNSRQLKANLVSKSRIEWINDVRQHTSSLIGKYHSIKMNHMSCEKEEHKQETDVLSLLKKQKFLLYIFKIKNFQIIKRFL